MDDFIGKIVLFRPAVIIVDKDQNPAGVSGVLLPELTNSTKSEIPGYDKAIDAVF